MKAISVFSWVILPVIAAGVCAAWVAGLSTSESLSLLGIPDPGRLTTYGLPAVRAFTEITLSVALGFSIAASFWAHPSSERVLKVDGYRAQRRGSNANFVAAACALFLVPLTLSDAAGIPLGQALSIEKFFTAVQQIDVADSWRWTAVLSFIAACGARVTVSWRWSVVWTAVSGLSFLPIAATGHAAASSAHDMATNSLIIHILAMSVWVGGLIAMVAAELSSPQDPGLAVRRFSDLAAWCAGLMVFSGIVNIMVRIEPAELVTTLYGQLIVVKIVALVALVAAGWWWRSRIIDAEIVHTASAWKVAACEIAIMAIAVGVSVALGRTPPAAPDSIPSIQEAALGFQLPGQASFGMMLTHWRFDMIFGTLAIILAGGYLVLFQKLRRGGGDWPLSRLGWWLAGCVTLGVSTSSGLGMYAMAMFSMHMLLHMLLSMMVPVFLVLGGPFTLALRALPALSLSKGQFGPREWLVEFINCRPSHFLTHPLVATVQFVVGFYVLYLTPLFDWMISEHMGHLLMNMHFLVSGYLFYWVIIGVDAAPRHFPAMTKLLTLLGSLPFHAFFGIALINYKEILGEQFYAQLALSWPIDLLSDQYTGGSIAWGLGEIPLLLVTAALSVQWRDSDQRKAKRLDRQAERTGDEELAAYNAMLADMAKGNNRQG